MVGANYMGGKRNTARTKSKDIVGRAQRRHFGKQRLASAVCVTQDVRVHTSAQTLSFLPEIALAHARRDTSMESGATSRKFTNGDQMYSSRSLSNRIQRNKPSKVLGVLDTSDHTSMRAAIDRILKQPTLVGIDIPKLREISPVRRMEIRMAVGRSMQARLASKDSNTRYSRTVSKCPVDSPEIPRHEHNDLHESNPNLNLRYWPTSVLSSPDSLSMMREIISWDIVDDPYTGVQLPREADPFHRTEGNEFDGTSAFPDAVCTLPRSSLFPPRSQSSNNSILDFDASPLAAIQFGRLEGLSEEDVDYLDTEELRSVPRPIFGSSSHSFSIYDVGVDEVQSATSPFTDSDELEVGCNNDHSSPSTRKNGFGHPCLSGYQPIHTFENEEVAGNDAPNKNLIDFLSDPHPWETIGRILELQPHGPSAAHFMAVSFTKGREGVGYVSLERSDTSDARSSDATFCETSADSRFMGISSGDPPIEAVDLEVPIADDRMTVAVPESPCANNSTLSLFDAKSPPTPRGHVDPCTHVHALHSGPYCTPKDHIRSLSGLTITVGTTTAEPDVDMIFSGPCLFGDSDLEDE